MINDMVIESAEPSPQQESGDASKYKLIISIYRNKNSVLVALANSSDIPKQIFLCIVASDKKVQTREFISHNLIFIYLVNNDITQCT
jgi:hypothetical protein